MDEGWEVTMSSAGHPPPLIIPAQEEPRPMATSGSLLGVLPSPRLTDTQLVLRPGDALLGFTDGVTEARRDEEFLGEDGLLASVQRYRAGGAEGLVSGVVDDVLAFQNQRPRDDVAVVAIRVPTG
jgi:sigma-B regulation protein RsbU (phosphoserine phosphatase)